MTINAVLERLVLASPQPAAVAAFYAKAFDYRISQYQDTSRCDAHERSLWFRPGAVNQLLESHFVFQDTEALQRYIEQLQARGVPYRAESSAAGPTVRVTDPDNRVVQFGVASGSAGASDAQSGDVQPARLQHYAVRTPTPQRLLDFYTEQLGFTVSDLVRNEADELMAAFMRTDAEHHALALFRAAEKRFDHCSCEAADWHALREWADRMGRASVPLVWGVGRHGPGNDTFFMVNDPDGNLAEISAELEVCADNRPVGFWPHEAKTLNLWGVAIMRS